MKATRRSFLSSVMALLLCISMFLGTTFAWFTDIVTSTGNIIGSGNLDAEMHWSDTLLDAESTEWKNADGVPVFTYDKWEPGYTEVKYIKVSNKSNLNFKWQLTIEAEGKVTDLADVIDVYYVNPVSSAITSLDGLTAVGTVNDVINGRTANTGSLTPDSTTILAIAFHMDELAGNEYQNKALCDAGFALKLLVTQDVGESDSFDDQYDANAVADFFPGFQGGSASASVAHNDQGVTTSEVTMDGGDVSAVIPAGVQVADGVSSLKLNVTMKGNSDANLQLGDTEEMQSLDVHIDGVAAGNTTPMLVTLKGYLITGINTGALKMYHVENGNTVVMTQVANPTNHNEFSYDPLTGDVTLALASFSEVAVVADTTNTWDGTAANSFAGGNGTEANPYQIANADQLAYFRNEVDGGRTFDNEFVKLTNNIYLSKVNFDPIGWGYEYNDWNRDDVAGKPFKGTFDGNDKTIFDLYQDGWDLESENGTDYTYTNCGFGLFAAAADATFKNLTIYGAYVRTECVEMGILVGLSQGSCTYENIEVHNSKIANYQRPTGGLIGEVSPLNGGGETKITNVTIGSDVVVGSLWGDFDAPCGGVIGARWDDSDTTTVNMKDVTVGCHMDVYSDVTSAYQWYAYRRAGMLIGNTEQTAENNQHLAAARFLTCENVKVYYGNWAAYHYAQFTNQDNDWANNYPWVRVEAGENCSAYSNPRYGVPVVNGVKVSDMDAKTLESTRSGYEELRFNQLYGGGQGVYGQAKHDGVEVVNYQYSITYVNDYQVLAIRYITAEEAKQNIETAYGPAKDLVVRWAEENIGKQGEDFSFDDGWMNAGSTKLTEIEAGNTKNIVLYPYFNKPYTARFVDSYGNVVAYCFFHEKDTTKLGPTKATAEAALPGLGEDFGFDYWEVHVTDDEGNTTSTTKYDDFSFSNATTDVTIYPVYKYNGDVTLIPVDSDGDGEINHYKVSGYSNPNGQAIVEIPGIVNGKPILEISGGAFSTYDGVHSIFIPEEVIKIGDNAFAEEWGTIDSGESITIYYGGSYADWIAKESNFGSNWESGISSSTRIFFLNGGDTVDVSQGYLQADVKSNWGNRTVTWNHNTTISESIKNEYTGKCNCTISTTGDTAHVYKDANENVMNHNADGTPVNANGTEIYLKESGWINKTYTLTDGTNTYYRYRPDAEYWEGVTVN